MECTCRKSSCVSCILQDNSNKKRENFSPNEYFGRFTVQMGVLMHNEWYQPFNVILLWWNSPSVIGLHLKSIQKHLVIRKPNINARAVFQCQGLSMYKQLTLLHGICDTGSHSYVKCMPWKSGLKQILTNCCNILKWFLNKLINYVFQLFRQKNFRRESLMWSWC